MVPIDCFVRIEGCAFRPASPPKSAPCDPKLGPTRAAGEVCFGDPLRPYFSLVACPSRMTAIGLGDIALPGFEALLYLVPTLP